MLYHLRDYKRRASLLIESDSASEAEVVYRIEYRHRFHRAPAGLKVTEVASAAACGDPDAVVFDLEQAEWYRRPPQAPEPHPDMLMVHVETIVDDPPVIADESPEEIEPSPVNSPAEETDNPAEPEI